MANDKIVVLSKDSFEEEVLKSEQLVLVDFWAPWCGPCRAVGPIMEELAMENGGNAKIAKVNVDEQGELAAKYRIMSIPTVLFFKGGVVVDKVIGARTKVEFAQMLEKNM